MLLNNSDLSDCFDIIVPFQESKSKLSVLVLQFPFQDDITTSIYKNNCHAFR